MTLDTPLYVDVKHELRRMGGGHCIGVGCAALYSENMLTPGY